MLVTTHSTAVLADRVVFRLPDPSHLLTGVRLWDPAYVRLLMVAALLAAGSAAIGALTGPSLPVACVVTAVATLLLVRLTGASLRIDESFPQVAGVPVLGRLLGLTRPAAGAGTVP